MAKCVDEVTNVHCNTVRPFQDVGGFLKFGRVCIAPRIEDLTDLPFLKQMRVRPESVKDATARRIQFQGCTRKCTSIQQVRVRPLGECSFRALAAPTLKGGDHVNSGVQEGKAWDESCLLE